MALGNIYIALVADGEVYNPVVHARNDFALVNVTPKWAEKDFWSLECEIDLEAGGMASLGGKTRVFISEQVNGQVEHSFTGRIEGWPIGPAGKTVSLTIKCKPATFYDDNGVIVSNAEMVEMAALAGINDDPWWLFSDPTDKRTSETVLAARSALLHWPRDETAPVLVDLIQGQGLIDIGDNYIEGTLTYEMPSEPIKDVTVTIKAEWPQAIPVVLDVGAQFANDGKFGTISTPKWDKIKDSGEKIGDWEVLSSSFASIDPIGGNDEYSRAFSAAYKKTKKVKASNEPEIDSVAVNFQRQFFDIDLVVASVLEATRREHLTFKVCWAGQHIAGYDGSSETISLECRNMRRDVLSGTREKWVSGVVVTVDTILEFNGANWKCIEQHQTGSSLYADFDKWDPVLLDFSPAGGCAPDKFLGAAATLIAIAPSGQVQSVTRDPPPGFRAIQYGMNQARAKIVSGIRIVRASFQVPWEDVRTITGRERIRIFDALRGEMVGKVVSIEADWIKGTATIAIAAAPGNGGIDPVPVTPVYDANTLQTQGVIRAIVAMGFEEQENRLAAYEFPQEYDLMKVLEQILRTRIDIELSPTSGKPDWTVALDMGDFAFDTDPMVEL